MSTTVDALPPQGSLSLKWEKALRAKAVTGAQLVFASLPQRHILLRVLLTLPLPEAPPGSRTRREVSGYLGAWG